MAFASSRAKRSDCGLLKRFGETAALGLDLFVPRENAGVPRLHPLRDSVRNDTFKPSACHSTMPFAGEGGQAK